MRLREKAEQKADKLPVVSSTKLVGAKCEKKTWDILAPIGRPSHQASTTASTLS